MLSVFTWFPHSRQPNNQTLLYSRWQNKQSYINLLSKTKSIDIFARLISSWLWCAAKWWIITKLMNSTDCASLTFVGIWNILTEKNPAYILMFCLHPSSSLAFRFLSSHPACVEQALTFLCLLLGQSLSGHHTRYRWNMAASFRLSHDAIQNSCNTDTNVDTECQCLFI